MWTYSQNFEDVILERLFSDAIDGFYVDVGAWDPCQHSVTAHFYKKGWHGINIEPIVERLEEFKRERPRDVNLAVAIANHTRPVSLFLYEAKTYLSTTDVSQAEKLRERGAALVERSVLSRTLNSILEEFAPSDIAFLKIDVEGSEAEVLATIDLRRWRPRVLLIEATEPATQLNWDHPEANGRWSDWEPVILGAGYIFGYFDGINRFYLRVEDRRLVERFRLPPGVFDEIENLRFHQDFVSQPQSLEEECAARLDIIDRLKQKVQKMHALLRTSEEERAAQLAVIGELKANNARLRAKLKDWKEKLGKAASHKWRR